MPSSSAPADLKRRGEELSRAKKHALLVDEDTVLIVTPDDIASDIDESDESDETDESEPDEEVVRVGLRAAQQKFMAGDDSEDSDFDCGSDADSDESDEDDESTADDSS